MQPEQQGLMGGGHYGQGSSGANPTAGGGYPQSGGGGGGGSGQPHDRQWKNLWFAVALLMMLMSILGGIECLFSGQIIDGVEFGYLFLFSLVVVIDNTSYMKEFMRGWRYSIGIYIQALRRMTFLGLFLIFVGSSMIGAFCNNDTGSFLSTLGFVAGGLGVLAGLLSVIFGARNSMTLEGLRKQFNSDSQAGRLENDFRTYAKSKQYLTPPEFVDMCKEKGISWDGHYNYLIFNALSWDKDRITLSQDAFMAWVRSTPSCLPTLI